jgi:hypothetical protein
MPLPLGHAVLGFTAHDLCSKDASVFHQWKLALFVLVLANLPDVDVVIGLLFQGNGNAFHRGPTHSLFFALLMGVLASVAWRIWSQIPRVSFRICFLVILSHVLADSAFTASSISLFWPLEVNWSSGYSGWRDIMGSVFLKGYQDVGIIIGCGAVMILDKLLKGRSGGGITTLKHLKIAASQSASAPIHALNNPGKRTSERHSFSQ